MATQGNPYHYSTSTIGGSPYNHHQQQYQSFQQPFQQLQHQTYDNRPLPPPPQQNSSRSVSQAQPTTSIAASSPPPYNHYTQYQPGSPAEQRFQQQQYQQYQNTLQQQQQQHQQQQQLQQQQLQQQQLRQQQAHGRSGSVTVGQTNILMSSLRDWFDAVDTDHSGRLSCEELQRALMNGDWTPFNVETVRLIVGMFDLDSDGEIEFSEFIGLWSYIEKWKACFQTFDLDNSGTIDRHELAQALRGFGYNLSDGIIELLVVKYSARGNSQISFDNFVQACVFVQSLTDAFRRFDVSGTGVAQMTYEQFLALVINNK